MRNLIKRTSAELLLQFRNTIHNCPQYILIKIKVPERRSPEYCSEVKAKEETKLDLLILPRILYATLMRCSSRIPL
jgi:hypothetical protein